MVSFVPMDLTLPNTAILNCFKFQGSYGVAHAYTSAEPQRLCPRAPLLTPLSLANPMVVLELEPRQDRVLRKNAQDFKHENVPVPSTDNRKYSTISVHRRVSFHPGSALLAYACTPHIFPFALDGLFSVGRNSGRNCNR